MRYKTAIIAVVALIGVTALGLRIRNTRTSQPVLSSSNQMVSTKHAVLYKSPLCGCCGDYTKYLEQNGYSIDVIKTEDMPTIKSKFNVPHNMESCHTMVIDGYVVEGHVPIKAIETMLGEHQSIDGIALPNMPAGSPGMPGIKEDPFIIYALDHGSVEEFLIL